MFLPEGKLMSGDGKVLKQFQRAVVRVFQDRGVSPSKAE
jgi:hypothetical protein